MAEKYHGVITMKENNDELESHIIDGMLDLLAGVENIEGSDIDKANALFRIIRAVSATSLAQLATDMNNLSEINNELHDGALKIATLIFNEQNKSPFPEQPV